MNRYFDDNKKAGWARLTLDGPDEYHYFLFDDTLSLCGRKRSLLLVPDDDDDHPYNCPVCKERLGNRRDFDAYSSKQHIIARLFQTFTRQHWDGRFRITTTYGIWLCQRCGGVVEARHRWNMFYGAHVTCPDCGTRWMLTGNYGDKAPVYVPLPEWFMDPPLTRYWQGSLQRTLPAPRKDRVA